MKNSAGTKHAHLWVKDIKEEDRIEGHYLVREKRVGTTRRGEPFISLTLADRTGDIEAKVWENAQEVSSIFSLGDIIEIEGYAGSYRDRLQVTVANLRVTKEEIDGELFLESAEQDPAEMMASLRGVLRGVDNVHLRALIDRFFNDRDFVDLFKRAPAAKNFHHSYLGGLLEHTLSVCRLTTRLTEHYPELDSNLMMAAAFLHDIGKIREFKYRTGIDYSDEGRLLGHVVLGVAMIDEKLKGLKKFPQELAVRLKHVVLSHHGQYEFGSPKRPKFLEAFALHMADDLDAKINGLGRFMARDRQEGAWTDYNRLFDRYLLKGDILALEEKSIEEAAKDDPQRRLFTETS